MTGDDRNGTAGGETGAERAGDARKTRASAFRNRSGKGRGETRRRRS